MPSSRYARPSPWRPTMPRSTAVWVTFSCRNATFPLRKKNSRMRSSSIAIICLLERSQLRVLPRGNYPATLSALDVIAKAETPNAGNGLFAHFVTISLMRFNLLSMRIESFWNSTRTRTLTRCGRRTSVSMFLRKGLRTRSRAGNPGPGISAFAPVIFLLVCSSLFAADKIKELQDHFDRDPHAATRIKTLDKLGLAEFESATKAGQAAITQPWAHF